MTSSHETSPFHQGKAMLAGGFGGVCLNLVGSPFDVIKVYQQTGTSARLGALATARSIWQKDGIRGYWKGVGPPLAASVPQFALVYWAYDFNRQLTREWRHGPSATSGDEDVVDVTLAGALVAIPTTFMYTPIERVKCLLQVDGKDGKARKYDGMLHCTRELLREGGIRHLFKGFWITLARDIPAWSAYFGVYHVCKLALSPPESQGVLDGQVELSPLPTIVAGSLAGSATWAACIVQDNLKTRWQTSESHQSFTSMTKNVIRAHGIRGGLFAGFATIVIGGAPRDAACFMGVEVANRGMTLMGIQ